MVLVDTSVWVQHFRHGDMGLSRLLMQDLVLTHPMILGELACGTPPKRAQTLTDIAALHYVHQASLPEVMAFIEQEKLYGLGCGLVDLSLLSSTILCAGTKLWTLDKRLAGLADRFSVCYNNTDTHM